MQNILISFIILGLCMWTCACLLMWARFSSDPWDSNLETEMVIVKCWFCVSVIISVVIQKYICFIVLSKATAVASWNRVGEIFWYLLKFMLPSVFTRVPKPPGTKKSAPKQTHNSGSSSNDAWFDVFMTGANNSEGHCKLVYYMLAFTLGTGLLYSKTAIKDSLTLAPHLQMI